MSQQNDLKSALEKKDEELTSLKDENLKLKSEIIKLQSEKDIEIRRLKIASQKVLDVTELLKKSNLLKKSYQTKLYTLRKSHLKLIFNMFFFLIYINLNTLKQKGWGCCSDLRLFHSWQRKIDLMTHFSSYLQNYKFDLIKFCF